MEKVVVRISGKMLREKFHKCDKKYILSNCHGRCCKNSQGVSVMVHQTEEARIKSYGCEIVDMHIKQDNSVCKFRLENGLCTIHKNKPLSCKASPFTVNRNGLIIIRNRYRRFRCYKQIANKVPAYEAHKVSLVELFGKKEVGNIVKQAKKGLGVVVAKMPLPNYMVLLDNYDNLHNRRYKALLMMF